MKLDAALMEADLAQCGARGREFEAAGFDGVLSFEGPHDPFLQLAPIAGETSRVELMTAIAIAFARNPMICAYMANDMHLISRGRFILGLGTQIKPHITRRFGQPWSKPNARIHEFVRAIRAIWSSWSTGERLNFTGEFYQHTLMTPFFSPGANPHGPPKIFLAGFGNAMVRVTGEVADGWITHPLATRDFILHESIPALESGLQTAGRARADFEIACETITMLGSNDEEIARAREQAKAQIAFYGSTPAYKVALDHHGWGDLQPVLNRMSKEGKWAEMSALITDDMLDTIGMSGTPTQIAKQLVARHDFADRVTMMLYNQTSPDAVTDIIRLVKSGG